MIIIIILHGGHTPADNLVYTGHQRIISNYLWTSLISDIGLTGHPCYGQTKVSADQYHVTISRAQVESSSRSAVFLKLTANQVLVSYSIAGSSQAKTRLHFSRAQPAARHGFQSTLLVFRLQTVLKKTFFLHFLAVLVENRFGFYSLRVCKRKDRVVWQGFNHAGAVFERCCVLNWTVLPLKILKAWFTLVT